MNTCPTKIKNSFIPHHSGIFLFFTPNQYITIVLNPKNQGRTGCDCFKNMKLA